MNTTEILWTSLENAFERYPNLKKIFPQTWPRHKKFGITFEKLAEFQKKRLLDDIEALNFPLLLYNAEFGSEKKVKEVFSSVLKKIDSFALNMVSTPGGKSILQPLWTDGWQDTRLWGVVSEIFYADLMVHQKFPILGFDRTITNSTETADIETRFDGKKTWIDIEAHTLKPFDGTQEEFRNLLEHRAKKKMSDKFSNLPSTELGMVASIYRIKSEQNMDKFTEYKNVTHPVPGPAPHITASIYWFSIGRYGEGEYFLALMDRTKDAIKLKSD